MKNYPKSIISLVLAVALVFSANISGVVSFPGIHAETVQNASAAVNEKSRDVVSVPAKNESAKNHFDIKSVSADPGILTECGGSCSHYPTIIVPGIGQGQVFLLDEEGNRKTNEDGSPATAWPIQVDSDTLIKDLAFPLAKMLITQKDNGFTDFAAKTVANAFAANATDANGQPVNRVEVVKYPRSVAACSPEDRKFIYSNIPVQGFSAVAGEDHLYYLGYNSFGNNLDIAGELYELIQLVKRETGHDKVNIAPISLGSTIAVSLLEFYPQVYDDLNKIIFIVPALDGTALVGDIYKGNLSLDDESLYRDLLPSLMDGYLGYLLNIVLRIIPKQVLQDLLAKTVAEIQQQLLFNCTMLWGLVPNGDYRAIAEKSIAGPAHAEIRRQTELYHRAQSNLQKNLLTCIDKGVRVFNIVDYNHPLFSFVPSSKLYNGDGLLDAGSSSMGATFGYIDTPLPPGYVQQDTYCTHPGEHNHISPEGIVDASTGLLPEHTFYFYNQDHERTAGCDIIIRLANHLLLYDDITDVHAMPERFPQFNTGRDPHDLLEDLLPAARSADINVLSPADAAELQAAVNACEEVLAQTVYNFQDFVDAQTRLENILAKIGLYEPYRESAGSRFAEILCKLLSDALYKYYGPRGFSDR
jgi:hypothetical protein